MPPPEMAGALSLGRASESTEMGPWLRAEAHCPSSSGVRAGHRHACGVGILEECRGVWFCASSTPLPVDNGAGMWMVQGAL